MCLRSFLKLFFHAGEKKSPAPLPAAAAFPAWAGGLFRHGDGR